MKEIKDNEKSIDIIVEFMRKYWNQLDHIIQMVNHKDSLNYEERKEEFLKGIKLNIDKFETDEKCANYIVRRVFNNRRKTYYEECIYWFLTQAYLVDRTTTKNSLYELAFNDISNLRNGIEEG